MAFARQNPPSNQSGRVCRPDRTIGEYRKSTGPADADL